MDAVAGPANQDDAEQFWAGWERAHARATDDELAQDAAETAAWDRASTEDLLETDRQDRCADG